MRKRHPRGRARRTVSLLLIVLLLATVVPPPADAQRAEADVFVAQAILAYEDKRYDDALAALNQALALDPKNVDALYYTGLVRVAQDRPDQAIEAFERARALAPRDESVLFQLGVVYFSQSKYDQAQPLLEQVFASRPSLDGLGYYVGFMRYRQKDYQGAVRAFRAGQSADPNIQQLTRFYNGLALAVLGLPDQAVAEIEEARRLQPASALTGPAERLRDAVIAAQQSDRRFRAEVRLGFFYDDNVAVNPATSGDPLVILLRDRDTSSFGEMAAVRFDYSFIRTGPWEAIATFSFFTTYNNDLPDFNIIDYLGALTGTYRGVIGGLPFQAGLQYTYDYLTLGGPEFVQRHTVAPFFTLVENAGNISSLQLRYQHKEFSHDTNIPREEKRDGANWMAGLLHLFRFQGDRHFVKVGYQFDYDDTEGPTLRGRNFSYVGHRLIAGGQYTLPWFGIRLKYDFDVHLRDYKHENTLFPLDAPRTVKRRDREYTSILGAVLPLPYNMNFALEWQRIWDNSNLDVFTYTRNVVSATLVWTY
jgi:tetratricopeptide (TPR) repeat protein